MSVHKSNTAIAYQPLLLLAAVFLAAIPLRSSAQPAPIDPAPSPAVDCFPYLINVSDCLSFIESGSNLTEPEKACCPELAQLVDTQPVCLCRLLSRPAQVGIPLDMEKALKLPSACNVSTPPVSFCAAVGVPVTDVSPSGAPSEGIGAADASPSPSGSLLSDGSGSSAVTTTADNGTPTNLPSYMMLISIPLVITVFTLCFF